MFFLLGECCLVKWLSLCSCVLKYLKLFEYMLWLLLSVYDVILVDICVVVIG